MHKIAQSRFSRLRTLSLRCCCRAIRTYLPCSSLDFNQIHDYQCECAHTILISGYPVVQVRSTVLNVECGVIESRMRFKAYVNTMTWNRP